MADDQEKLDTLIDKYEDTKKKIKDFSHVLDSIEASSDKKKILWKEIYSNAVTDRENASILFTDAFKSMQVGTNEHAVLGPTLTKYIERMCKSNEQILRLAELIAKSEDRASKVNPEDIFAQISD